MINTLLAPPIPIVEPFTVTRLAANLRLITDESVEYSGPELLFLQGLIEAAREAAENYCHRNFVDQYRELRYQDWALQIPYFTADHEDAIITYIDAEGVSQELDAATYTWQPTPKAWDLVFNSDVTLPELHEFSRYAVIVNVTIKPGFVKKVSVQAMILIASYWYENREAGSHSVSGGVKEIPLGFRHLLDIETRLDVFA